jgi:hypothetical protein
MAEAAVGDAKTISKMMTLGKLRMFILSLNRGLFYLVGPKMSKKI